MAGGPGAGLGLPARVRPGREPSTVAVPGHFRRPVGHCGDTRSCRLRPQRRSRPGGFLLPVAAQRNHRASGALRDRNRHGDAADVVLAVGWRAARRTPLRVLGADGEGWVRPGSSRRSGMAPDHDPHRRLRPGHVRSPRLPARHQPGCAPPLRIRRRERRDAHVPVRQHLRTEPDPRRRVGERTSQRNADVPRPGPAWTTLRRSGVLAAGGLGRESGRSATVPRPSLG